MFVFDKVKRSGEIYYPQWMLACLIVVCGSLFFMELQAQQDTIWYEGFDNLPNSMQQNPPRWTTSFADGDGRGGFWGVSSGEFRVNDIEGAGNSNNNFFFTEKFAIDSFVNVSFSVDYRHIGTMECDPNSPSGHDEIITEYSIDGGPWTEACIKGNICGSIGLPGTANQAGIAGDSLEIRIRLGNKAQNENYYFDDILVVGYQSALPVLGADAVVKICEGDSAMIAGAYRKLPGRFFEVLQDANGCDSITVIALQFDEVKRDTLNTLICEGDSIFLGKAFRKVAGTYEDSLQTARGCDSIITTNLKVLSAGGDTLEIHICQGDSLFIGGQFRKTTGFYDELISRSGCDSLSTTALIVDPVYQLLSSYRICQGDSVMVNGRALKQAGTFFDFLQTKQGCDSILVSNVTVTPRYDYTILDSICKGDSIFLEKQFRKTGGIYRDTFQTKYGCDSLVTTDLFIIPAKQAAVSSSICQGDSILLGGIYRHVPGVYRDTLMALSTGCDSIRFVQLTVLNRPVHLVDTFICRGDSILIAGKYIRKAGVYDSLFSTTDFCDSLVRYQLAVGGALDSVNLQLCFGDSIQIGGKWRKSDGVYADSLKDRFTCDSIKVYTLRFRTQILKQLSGAICEGDSLMIFGNYEKIAGTYLDTFPSAGACDSIVSYTLQVSPIIRRSFSRQLCQGDSLFFDGRFLKQSGTYEDTLQAQNSCDSIVTLQLSLVPLIQTQNTLGVCEGDSILIHGEWRKTAGTYKDTLSVAAGCDSISEVQLIVYQEKSINQNFVICEGDTINIVGTPRWLSGIYYDTLVSSEGCDSVVVSTVTVLNNVKDTIHYKRCLGDTVFIQSVPYFSDTTFTRHYPAMNGCDSLVSSILTFSSPDPSFSYTLDEAIRKLSLFPDNSNYTFYNWSFGDGFSSTNISPSHQYDVNASYQVKLQVMDANGCTDSSKQELLIRLNPELDIPNVFTPNGDGVNDRFRLETSGDFEMEIVIYNRWGQEVFQSKDRFFEWDGKKGNQALENGQYFYVISGEFEQKGTITLMR
jgi:gliding motility-associated-like protein